MSFVMHYRCRFTFCGVISFSLEEIVTLACSVPWRFSCSVPFCSVFPVTLACFPRCSVLWRFSCGVPFCSVFLAALAFFLRHSGLQGFSCGIGVFTAALRSVAYFLRRGVPFRGVFPVAFRSMAFSCGVPFHGFSRGLPFGGVFPATRCSVSWRSGPWRSGP